VHRADARSPDDDVLAVAHAEDVHVAVADVDGQLPLEVGES